MTKYLFLLVAIGVSAAWAAWTPANRPKGVTTHNLLRVTEDGSPTADTADRPLIQFTNAAGVLHTVVYRATTGGLLVVVDSSGSAVTTTSTSTSTTTTT